MYTGLATGSPVKILAWCSTNEIAYIHSFHFRLLFELHEKVNYFRDIEALVLSLFTLML